MRTKLILTKKPKESNGGRDDSSSREMDEERCEGVVEEGDVNKVAEDEKIVEMHAQWSARDNG